MISDVDISIVVQGPVVKNLEYSKEEQPTYFCLRSLRKIFPKAELIFSTWRGSDVCNLDYDIVIENEDPGAVLDNSINISRTNNLNRQIVSSRNGILKASRKYVIKVRSDMIFRSNKFLKYWNVYPYRCDNFLFTKKRVLSCALYAMKTIPIGLEIAQFLENVKVSNEVKNSYYPFLFHPSDWFFFGLVEDIFNIFDIPLQPEPQTSLWFQENALKVGECSYKELLINFVKSKYFVRYRPEQYIWISFLKKHTKITFDHLFDYSEKNLLESELSIVNNLMILDIDQCDFFIQKCSGRKNGKYCHLQYNQGYWETYYRHIVWLRLYKKYCQKPLVIFPTYDSFRRYLFLIECKIGEYMGCVKKCLKIAAAKIFSLSIFL